MAPSHDVQTQVVELANRAKKSCRAIAAASTEQKNAVLHRAAEAIRTTSFDAILEANAQDMFRAQGGDSAVDDSQVPLSEAMLDRLVLSPERLRQVADAVDQVAVLPDPVGKVFDPVVRPGGLKLARMRIPIGLIGMIYESRPNVTADAAALCLKSGNAVLLRGGKEAFSSNLALAAVFGDALEAEGLDRVTACLLPTTDRQATLTMVRLDGVVDLVIPRGGTSLIEFVAENARVPVIRHYKGVCHVYVDADANLDMALAVVRNSKVQRPGVCNAMETLLIDRAGAAAFVPKVVGLFQSAGVEVRGDAATCALVPESNGILPAEPEDWDREYLDLIVSVAIVDGLEGAMEHISLHGSNHTEAIVTGNAARALRFQREVDASLVLVNASTRFNDGAQLGLGAEIGISTTKLHAYGPMGLNELCTVKWIGNGQGNTV